MVAMGEPVGVRKAMAASAECSPAWVMEIWMRVPVVGNDFWCWR